MAAVSGKNREETVASLVSTQANCSRPWRCSRSTLTVCFRLIHFHIGSQITKIRRIKTALREAAQFYVQLHAMGFKIEFVDIGGGLGVDYDGTRSSFTENSINYSIQEYVNDSVFTFVDAADKNGIPHPNIITESGRALTAHHSVLVFEVLETATLPEWPEDMDIQPDDHELVKELYNIWESLTQARMLVSWHDAQQIRRSRSTSLVWHARFEDSRTGEQLYFSIAREINITSNRAKMTEELRQPGTLLPDKYFCNFPVSVVARLMAIDQVPHHSHTPAR